MTIAATRSLPADGSVDSRPAPPSAHAAVVPADARGAVIIPAHDEAAVIARTLRSLEPLAALEGFEVIVVCNGCSDDTAAIARGFAGVHVEEIDEASKTAALNAADRIATAWPRLYLDADIEIPVDAVLDVFAALDAPGLLAARPSYVYDTVGASAPVVGYYRARSRIPGQPVRLWGAGGYAANEAGHAKFGEFARVTADDSWFDEQFELAEKRIVPTAPMRVRTPRDTAGLLAVLTRQRRGYLELGIAPTTGERGRALLASVRGPRSAADLAWYVILTAISRRRAARILRGTDRAWERDASSRTRTGTAR